MPALPLDEAGKYVAAAYLVFLALILIYVAIMAAKLQRIDREIGELADLAERRGDKEPPVGARDEVPVQAAHDPRAMAPAPAAPGGKAEEAAD
jgi:hypothetical protein